MKSLLENENIQIFRLKVKYNRLTFSNHFHRFLLSIDFQKVK